MRPDVLLVHLYPELLSTYGDRGNLLTLRRRAEWRGLSTQVREVTLGERIPPGADVIILGGGTDAVQGIAAADLSSRRAELHEALGHRSVLFGVCGGYQLLGHSYRAPDGRTIGGLGLLDVRTEAARPRLVGPARVSLRLWGATLEVVGFENHAGRTRLGPGAQPLGRVLAGFGNDGEGDHEGATMGSVLGTYLHGPVLALNPGLADLILRRALGPEHQESLRAPLDDRLAEAAQRLLT